MPMYGDCGHWRCMPTSRSMTAIGVNGTRSSSSCRARRARFSSRSDRTRSAVDDERVTRLVDIRGQLVPEDAGVVALDVIHHVFLPDIDRVPIAHMDALD